MGVWKFYPTPEEMGEGKMEGLKPWPTVTTLKMKPEELWPTIQAIPSHPRSNIQGRKIVTVTGKKYRLQGGFKREFINNMTSPNVAKLICEAANHSLAFNKWTSYER